MHDLKDFIVYIVLVVALFLVLGSCEKAKDQNQAEQLHMQYQEGYKEGYATGYEEGNAAGTMSGYEAALDEIEYLYGIDYPDLRH